MTHTVTHTMQKTQRTGKEVRLPNRCAVLLSFEAVISPAP